MLGFCHLVKQTMKDSLKIIVLVVIPVKKPIGWFSKIQIDLNFH